MNVDRASMDHFLGVTVVVFRYVILIASTLAALAVTHDLIQLSRETPAALVLCIPVGFLLARWVLWVRSVVGQPVQTRKLVEVLSR